MKINEIKTPVGMSTGLDPASGKKSEKPQTEAVDAKSSGDVTLSAMSAQLKSLEAKVAADNVFDAKKVDEIKSAISSGQFKVNSEKVADGLIESVKDLLTTKNTAQPNRI